MPATYKPGDVISHAEMCVAEGFMLQAGMNFRTRGGISVILMSIRPGAPYNDQVEDGGRVLTYEGHDVPRSGARNPKSVDQQSHTPRGTLTRNGSFYGAAKLYGQGKADAEFVRVYEKVKQGIWVYNGTFRLVDASVERNQGRKVFKFKLEITDSDVVKRRRNAVPNDESRMIPTSVKLAVWKRDKGVCRLCGSNKNLHFDHIIPWSKGGTSFKTENVQLLCAKHNLAKHDRIE